MTPSDPKRLPPPSRPVINLPENGAPPHLPVPVNPAPLPVPVVPPQPPAVSSEATAGALLQALRRCWLLALAAGVVAAAVVGLGIYFLVPAKYTATATLHVASRVAHPLFGSWESNDDFTMYVRTQSALLKSKMVLNGALRQAEVAGLEEVREQSNPQSWLEKNLKVESNQAPEIVRLSLSGDRPDDLAAILNAVCSVFLKEVGSKEQTKQRLRVEGMQANYRAHVQTLQSKKQSLRQHEEILKVDDEATAKLKRDAAIAQFTQVEKSFFDTKLARTNAERELAALREKLKSPTAVQVTQSALDERLSKDTTYKKHQDRLDELEQLIADTKSKVVPSLQRQAIEAPNSMKAGPQKELEKRSRHVQALLKEELQIKADDELRQNIGKQEDAVARLKEQESALGAEVKRRDAEVRGLSPAGKPNDKPFAELEVLRNEVHQMEDLRKKMADQIDLLKVEPLPPPRVNLLEAADPPTTRNQDRLLKLAGIAAFGAFFLGLGGVAYNEFRRRRIHSASDVVQGLGLRLIGTLPALPSHLRTVTPGAATPKDVYWQQRLSESVDAVRSQLLHAAQTDSLGIVMVTSALAGEGKTSLASHLATSLARAWRKTLLIDCDLRNPGAHRLFEVPLEPGFSEVLRGDIEFDDVVKPTPVSRLWMIPAGNWDSHAIQALAQEGVRSIFERLKEQYDFIILDSSPVLPVADALSLGQHVDGVILSVLSEVSRIPTVHAAEQRLSSLGIRVFGAVVIGSREDVPGIAYPYPRQ